MADKDWDDTPYVDGDCVRDEAEWNDMITYVKHSAASTFTIYDDEDSTNQIFKFTHSGVNSQMYGGDDAADVLYIYSNSINFSPYIKLTGGGDFECVLSPSDNFKILDAATEILNISYAANITTLEGGAVVGDDLLLIASSAGVYPKMQLHGNSGINTHVAGGADWRLYDVATESLRVGYAANITTLEGGAVSGDDLVIKGNSNNAYPYIQLVGNSRIDYKTAGTEPHIFCQVETEIVRLDYAANVTTITGGNVTGDDLELKGNNVDAYSKIVLEGDNNINIHTGAGDKVINLYEGATAYGYFQEYTDFKIGSQSNRNIFLEPHGTGLVKFGTYTASTITHTGYITMKDAGGTNRLVMIGEV